MFRRQLPPRYPPQVLDAPGSAIQDQRLFQVGWVVLRLLLVGYFTAEGLGIPASAVAISSAALLWLVAARGRVIDTRRVLKGASWQTGCSCWACT